MQELKLATVNNCMNCGFCSKHVGSGGSHPDDYVCGAVTGCYTDRYGKQVKGRLIASAEYPSERPQDHVFPSFCPLESKKDQEETLRKDMTNLRECVERARKRVISSMVDRDIARLNGKIEGYKLAASKLGFELT